MPIKIHSRLQKPRHCCHNFLYHPAEPQDIENMWQVLSANMQSPSKCADLPEQIPSKWANLHEQTRLQIAKVFPGPIYELPYLSLDDLKTKLSNAVESTKLTKGPSHEDTLELLTTLGLLQSDTRDSAATGTCREILALVDKPPTNEPVNPGARLSATHNLSRELMLNGEFAEAEIFARQVHLDLVERLGLDSPQALGSQRVIIEAVSCQNRTEEAKRLLDEGIQIVGGMAGGRWAVYQQDELEAMEEVRMKLAELFSV